MTIKEEKHQYIVLFRGDDSDFVGNQQILLKLETELDLTGCKAHFRFLDFKQDFDEIPVDKTLELVFPKSSTANFPIGAIDAELWLEDSTGKRRTVANRIHVVVTNSVKQAYENDDPQAITVVITSGSAESISWNNITDKPSTFPPSAHTHAQSDVTGLPDALAARPTKAQMDAGWWSEWTISPDDGTTIIWSDTESSWYFIVNGDGRPATGGDVENEDATYIEYQNYTATRHRVAAPVPTKPEDIDAQPAGNYATAAQGAKADTALQSHQQLTPIYGGNGEPLSEWDYHNLPAGSAFYDDDGISFFDGTWVLRLNIGSFPYVGETSGTATDTELEFSRVYARDEEDEPEYSITATRTANPIVGYTLGSQSTKPLQPKGDYAPATNIPKTALASNVQTSLGLADTAVQPSAMNAAIDEATKLTQGYSNWEFLIDGHPTIDEFSLRYEVHSSGGGEPVEGWYPYVTLPGSSPVQLSSTGKGTPESTSLMWTNIEMDLLPAAFGRLTATRKKVDGYFLGNRTDSALADAAKVDERFAGKQDSLSAAQLANIAAVPNKADASALRYDLGTPIVIDTASSEMVEGETITYGAATLADRTANRVAITAALDELRLAFPPAVSGKVRDFGLRVEVGDGTAALAAPALEFVAVAGETVTLENADGAIPALADGAADAKGVTLLYFSETAPGVFVVKGEQVEEVA